MLSCAVGRLVTLVREIHKQRVRLDDTTLELVTDLLEIGDRDVLVPIIPKMSAQAPVVRNHARDQGRIQGPQPRDELAGGGLARRGVRGFDSDEQVAESLRPVLDVLEIADRRGARRQ